MKQPGTKDGYTAELEDDNIHKATVELVDAIIHKATVELVDAIINKVILITEFAT